MSFWKEEYLKKYKFRVETMHLYANYDQKNKNNSLTLLDMKNVVKMLNEFIKTQNNTLLKHYLKEDMHFVLNKKSFSANYANLFDAELKKETIVHKIINEVKSLIKKDEVFIFDEKNINVLTFTFMDFFEKKLPDDFRGINIMWIKSHLEYDFLYEFVAYVEKKYKNKETQYLLDKFILTDPKLSKVYINKLIFDKEMMMDRKVEILSKIKDYQIIRFDNYFMYEQDFYKVSLDELENLLYEMNNMAPQNINGDLWRSAQIGLLALGSLDGIKFEYLREYTGLVKQYEKLHSHIFSTLSEEEKEKYSHVISFISKPNRDNENTKDLMNSDENRQFYKIKNHASALSPYVVMRAMSNSVVVNNQNVFNNNFLKELSIKASLGEENLSIDIDDYVSYFNLDYHKSIKREIKRVLSEGIKHVCINKIIDKKITLLGTLNQEELLFFYSTSGVFNLELDKEQKNQINQLTEVEKKSLLVKIEVFTKMLIDSFFADKLSNVGQDDARKSMVREYGNIFSTGTGDRVFNLDFLDSNMTMNVVDSFKREIRASELEIILENKELNMSKKKIGKNKI